MHSFLCDERADITVSAANGSSFEDWRARILRAAHVAKAIDRQIAAIPQMYYPPREAR